MRTERILRPFESLTAGFLDGFSSEPVEESGRAEDRAGHGEL